jgi:CTP:molybdopterin cytidylyltransferase MocA
MTPQTPPVAAVLLAAGGGTRFGGEFEHKLLAELGGVTVFERSLNTLLDASLADEIGFVGVVWGALDLRDYLPGSVTPIHNPEWITGQASSLQRAVQWARQLGASALCVGLADMCGVLPSAWRAVAGTDAPIAVAQYGERRSPPVRLAAEVWPLLPRTGDTGASELIRSRPDLVTYVRVDGDPTDIDTEEDAQRWS